MAQFKKYDVERIFGIRYSQINCLGKRYRFISLGLWFFGFEFDLTKK